LRLLRQHQVRREQPVEIAGYCHLEMRSYSLSLLTD